MVTDVSVFQSLDHEGKWGVAFDGEWAVSFYGPRARQLAERHRDELAQLIVATKRFVAETCNAMRIATNHPGYDVMTEPCNGGEEQKSNASESARPGDRLNEAPDQCSRRTDDSAWSNAG